jgi:anhydro-N-acetylmuramic acid kinase
MSGTSLDGVDVALCEIDKLTCAVRNKEVLLGCKLISFLEYPFPLSLKSELLHVISSSNTLEKIGILDHKLAHLFSDAINALLAKENLTPQTINAIGLHGQTLWHQPFGAFPFTMQLGDANIVYAQTGIKVIADFRRADVALGGQGAPFAPAFHQFYFADKKKVAILNIGGMANITILAKPLIGYDTGPGNVLMDYWIDKNQQTSFDKDGLWAKSGEINSALLSQMLKEAYFSMPYPKSTGRELFNPLWLEKQLENFSLEEEDIQATLLALSIQSIIQELKKFDIETLIVCGGGGKNSFFMDSLQKAINPISLEINKESDMLEAMAFAWLAYKRVHREKVALKSVTGASKDTLLGGIYG